MKAAYTILNVGKSSKLYDIFILIYDGDRISVITSKTFAVQTLFNVNETIMSLTVSSCCLKSIPNLASVFDLKSDICVLAHSDR